MEEVCAFSIFGKCTAFRNWELILACNCHLNAQSCKKEAGGSEVNQQIGYGFLMLLFLAMYVHGIRYFESQFLNISSLKHITMKVARLQPAQNAGLLNKGSGSGHPAT